LVNVFFVNTSRWRDPYFEGEEDKINEYFMTIELNGDTVEDCLEKFVAECNLSYTELYAVSFKVHHLLVYQDSNPDTLQVIYDLSPYKGYFEQIRCYDWNL
jgi:hypothetical protein